MNEREAEMLAHHAFAQGNAALALGDLVDASRWLDRACRLAPLDQNLRIMHARVANRPLEKAPVTVSETVALPQIQGTVLLVSHALGGGVHRHVMARSLALRADGWRTLLLRPDAHDSACGSMGVLSGETDWPWQRFSLPVQYLDLLRCLEKEGVERVEFHHLMGHRKEIWDLPRLLSVGFSVVVHDYALVCPRITLTGGSGIYCGEPLAAADCDACVATYGSLTGEVGSIASLRERSAAWIGQAKSVLVPSSEVARRLKRYMPDIEVSVRPWEDDTILLAPAVASIGRKLRICVVGAINSEKGYDVLLACARDAVVRRLDLEFVVVGYTQDDLALLDTGIVFVTGAYTETEAVDLIKAQSCTIGFLPSCWPETWSYTLGLLWQAGLAVVTFNLGTPAKRIEATGHGWTLPLGLPAGQTNDAFLRDFKLSTRG